jgi:hypothetical protein
VCGQIPVVAQCNEWVCGRSLSGNAGSNSADGIDIGLLIMLCTVGYRSLLRADRSSRVVLASVACLSGSSTIRVQGHVGAVEPLISGSCAG